MQLRILVDGEEEVLQYRNDQSCNWADVPKITMKEASQNQNAGSFAKPPPSPPRTATLGS